MKFSYSSSRRLVASTVAVTLTWFSLQAFAQVSAEISPESVAQIEQTYRSELRRIHLPLISSYITELQRLSAESRSSQSSVAIDNELRAMQAIITEGGVVNLRNAYQISADPEAEMPMPDSNSASVPAKLAKALLILTPALASKVQPTLADTTGIEAIPVIEIEWLIEALPAGSFDVALQYAYPAAIEGLELYIKFGRSELEIPLSIERTTQSSEDFKVLRIGRIVLATDAENEPLKLVVRSGDGEPLAAAPLLIRQVLVARDKQAIKEP